MSAIPAIPKHKLNGGDKQLTAEAKHAEAYAAHLVEAQRLREESAIARRDARQNQKELYGIS